MVMVLVRIAGGGDVTWFAVRTRFGFVLLHDQSAETESIVYRNINISVCVCVFGRYLYIPPPQMCA